MIGLVQRATRWTFEEIVQRVNVADSFPLVISKGGGGGDTTAAERAELVPHITKLMDSTSGGDTFIFASAAAQWVLTEAYNTGKSLEDVGLLFEQANYRYQRTFKKLADLPVMTTFDLVRDGKIHRASTHANRVGHIGCARAMLH